MRPSSGQTRIFSLAALKLVSLRFVSLSVPTEEIAMLLHIPHVIATRYTRPSQIEERFASSLLQARQIIQSA